MASRSRSCLSRRSAPRTRTASRLLVGIGLALTTLGCSTFSLAPSWHPLSEPVDAPGVVGLLDRHTIAGEETLLDLTRRYQLGYVELLAANPGVDPWVPGVGTDIILPTAHLVPLDDKHPRRPGLLINLADQRLYVFPPADKGRPHSYPIGVSRDGFDTPIGHTTVVRKKAAPTWTPTLSARREDPTLPRVVGPGPENPLGDFALYLDWPLYLIHGTNEPDGVGRRVSRGCIRLYPEHIEKLFALVPVGAKVRVVHEPVKIARVGDDLFLEVHPTLEDMESLEVKGALDEIRPDDLRPRIRAFAGPETSERIDWSLAYRTAAERRGVPVQITR